MLANYLDGPFTPARDAEALEALARVTAWMQRLDGGRERAKSEAGMTTRAQAPLPSSGGAWNSHTTGSRISDRPAPL